jgi:hypothetical protein
MRREASRSSSSVSGALPFRSRTLVHTSETADAGAERARREIVAGPERRQRLPSESDRLDHAMITITPPGFL